MNTIMKLWVILAMVMGGSSIDAHSQIPNDMAGKTYVMCEHPKLAVTLPAGKKKGRISYETEDGGRTLKRSEVISKVVALVYDSTTLWTNKGETWVKKPLAMLYLLNDSLWYLYRDGSGGYIEEESEESKYRYLPISLVPEVVVPSGLHIRVCPSRYGFYMLVPEEGSYPTLSHITLLDGVRVNQVYPSVPGGSDACPAYASEVVPLTDTFDEGETSWTDVSYAVLSAFVTDNSDCNEKEMRLLIRPRSIEGRIIFVTEEISRQDKLYKDNEVGGWTLVRNKHFFGLNYEMSEENLLIDRCDEHQHEGAPVHE